MGGLDKAAHVKLQGYINTLVPEEDRPYSIIFDRVEAQLSFQRRIAVITNGTGYLLISTDVDYTEFIHGSADSESEPIYFHMPPEALKPLMNHRIATLEDDSQKLKILTYVPGDEPDWTDSDIDHD